VRAYIRANLERYLNELRDFASIPSVSANAAGITDAAHWVSDALHKRGARTRIYQTAGKPVVVATIGTGDRTVLMYNHYDVQPPGAESSWTSPPFIPAIRDGKMYGRGCIDDKGEIIARLAALDALLDRHAGELPCRLTFLIEGEEESGSPNLDAFLAEHRNELAADACIWEAGSVDEEGRPLIWLGVRGLLYVRLHVKTMKHDAHSGWAHALPNAAWRLVAALATLRDKNGNITIDGFLDGMTGPTARQRELLEAMAPEEPALEREFGINRFVADRTGFALRESVFAPTCNITGMWSGHTADGMKTVTPSEANAAIDFRLVPGQDPQRCVDALAAHFVRHGYEDIELSPAWAQGAACSDPDHDFIALTIQTLGEHYQTAPVVVPMVGGTGPAESIVRHLGVPFASIGCSYPGGRKHAPDENIRFDDFVRGAAAIADILERYSGVASNVRTIASM
jgi:acetylornithine deacetylase/succinyl-diaminopimelate desuccinylase-like protein